MQLRSSRYTTNKDFGNRCQNTFKLSHKSPGKRNRSLIVRMTNIQMFVLRCINAIWLVKCGQLNRLVRAGNWRSETIEYEDCKCSFGLYILSHLLIGKCVFRIIAPGATLHGFLGVAISYDRCTPNWTPCILVYTHVCNELQYSFSAWICLRIKRSEIMASRQDTMWFEAYNYLTNLMWLDVY
jgi:hypothetical protein